MNKILLCFSVLCLLPSSMALANQEKNPFVPYGTETTAAIQTPKSAPGDLSRNRPLDGRPLATYKVVGVIVAKDDALAVIKTKEGYDYFVEAGDKLGSEGGVIKDIHPDGIVVAMGEEGEDLVDVMVSNKVETIPSEQIQPTN